MSTYKVIDFNEATGQIFIDFAEGMTPLIVDVPIKDGLYITGAELDQYIKGFIPTWHLERHAQITAGVANVQELKNLVVQTVDTELPAFVQQSVENAAMLAEEQFEQHVAKVLVKFGVLESDPTAIPVNSQ
jgi:hypothetical protein